MKYFLIFLTILTIIGCSKDSNPTQPIIYDQYVDGIAFYMMEKQKYTLEALNQYSDDCYIYPGTVTQLSWSIKGATTEQFTLLILSGEDTLWISEKMYADHRLTGKEVLNKKFSNEIKVFMVRDIEEPEYTISAFVTLLIKKN